MDIAGLRYRKLKCKVAHIDMRFDGSDATFGCDVTKSGGLTN